ncbi:MAG: hypothetical protein R2713_09800 [Ilumatobacteraceae bacterium]
MAILHGHYAKLLKLDGADARDEASAAAVLGIKPGFPARKALDQYRRLSAPASPVPSHCSPRPTSTRRGPRTGRRSW